MYAVSQVHPHLWCITLAKPFTSHLPAARPNNVYLLTGEGGPALINAGHPAQFSALSNALRDCGVEVSQIERVIATSWSLDHLGAAPRLRHADVFVLSPDMLAPRHLEPVIRARMDAWRSALDAWLAHAQVPDSDDVRASFDAFERAWAPNAADFDTFIPIRQGHILRAADLTLEVFATPGPNEGHACLFERERGWLFSSELGLQGLPEHVSGVRAYLNSLARMMDLDPQHLLPSFGQPQPRAKYALLRSLRFLDNFLTNAPLTLSEGPTLFEFVYRDLGLAPSDHIRYAATLLSYRAFLEELGRSGVIDTAWEGFERRYGIEASEISG